MTIEKHVRYNTDVTTLTEAWAFIMEHVDQFPAPTIGIEAWTRYEVTYTDRPRAEVTGYTATIHGNVNA